MNWIEPDWPLPLHVHAAVTLKTGGISKGNYASMNPALHVGDDPVHVEINRKLIREMLHLPADPVWLQQVHGTQVADAASANGCPQADASVTADPDIVCAVLTADCLPVLFCGDQGNVVAAAHAGWRGLQAGVLQQTVKHMNCKDIQAWLGPAIGPNSFEVGEDVRTAFTSANRATNRAFRPSRPNKWLADIYSLASIILTELGIQRIYGGGFCTFTDQRFYSYRRDGASTGRMASLIWRDAN